ncbi:MAG: putative toxin-antitoxin system toxin component, PIN family [Candidatus Bathyarchaeota archaeon]|nr:putative toxin-antitoxin system toxin component, PIN family [Candidatus Bathyarchaeota archaeon]
MRVAVFDVNVLVSSLIVKGKPRDLWLKARANEFTLLLSSQIVSEFVDVISRRKFAKYVKEYDVKVFLEALHQTAKFTRIKSKFKVVKADPADDTILRTAFDGKADCIVSGDKHLLALKEFRGIKILTVDEMLSLLKEEKPPK